MESAANAAGRPRPPLIMHVPLVLSRDAASVRAAIRENFGFYVHVSNYIQMFVDAGFPEARESQWSDRMIDAVAVYGSESEVADRLKALIALGADEILVSPVGIGPIKSRRRRRSFASSGAWRLLPRVPVAVA